MTIAALRPPALAIYSCILFFSSYPTQAAAQLPEKDSVVASIAWSGTLRTYHEVLKPETRLYKGKQYVEYAYTIKAGHPYFNDDHFQKGSVFYDGVQYDDLDLLYDLIKGEVVIKDPSNIYKIALINERLDRFNIQDHSFIQLRDSIQPSAPSPGFYEQLYRGERALLLKKEKKTVQEDPPSAEGPSLYVTHSVSYYLRLGATYYNVNNKRSLFRVMKNKKGDLRRYLRSKGLRRKKDKEQALMAAAAWYDSIMTNSGS